MMKLLYNIKTVFLGAAALMLLSMNPAIAQDVELDFGDHLAGRPGEEVTAHVSTSDLTGLDVYNFQFEISFDTQLLSIDEENIVAGEMTAGGEFLKTVSGNTINIGWISSQPLTGSGELFSITGTLGPAGVNLEGVVVDSYLVGEDGALDVVPVTPVNITVTSSDKVIQLPAISGQPQQNVTGVITTDDLSDLGVYAYELEFTYDSDIINFTGVSTTGTVSAGGLVSLNSVSPGVAQIAAAFSAPVPAGSQLLVLEAELLGETTKSSLVFTSVEMYDGDGNLVPVAGLSGSVTSGVVQARAQIIHNSADPAAALVDIYANGDLLVGDLGFRQATPFVTLPAEEALTIDIYGAGADPSEDLPVFTMADVVLPDASTLAIIANGVLGTGFAENPNGFDTEFTLHVVEAKEESGDQETVSLYAWHGATDVMGVNVIARDVGLLAGGLAYGPNGAPHTLIDVPSVDYIMDVNVWGTNDVATSFSAPLSSLGGSAIGVLASGFLSPGNNQNGEALVFIAVLPDGTVLELPAEETLELEALEVVTVSDGDWNDPSVWEVNGSAPLLPPAGYHNFSVEHVISANIPLYSVTGNVVVSGEGRINTMGGSYLQFADGSVYQHDRDGGNMPTSYWRDGSTVLMTGTVQGAPGNRNQGYYNLVLDTPNLSANRHMDFNEVVIRGDITINSTGTHRWYLTGAGNDESTVTTIMGDVIMNGGEFSVNGTSSLTYFDVYHYGNIIVNNGNFSVSRGSQSNGLGYTRWHLFGDFIFNRGTAQNSNPNNAYYIISGEGEVQNLVIGTANIIGAGLQMTVAPEAVLNLGESVVRGEGEFNVLPGAEIQTALAQGFDDALMTTGSVNLSTGGNYTFNGTEAQSTGFRVPGTVNNMTIDNDAGVALSKQTTVNGTLLLANGVLDNTAGIILGEEGLIVYQNGSLLIPEDPYLAANPAALDFGEVAVGASGAITMRIQNNGGVPITVTRVTSSESEFRTNFPGNRTINPGADLAVRVTYVPDEPGAHSGTLTIVSNDPGGNTEVALIGQTVGFIAVGVNPEVLDFGDVVPGESRAITASIVNNGVRPLTVTRVTSSLPEFRTNFPGNRTINPGASLNIRVVFAPEEAKLYEGVLTIVSNDKTSPEFTVDMVGTAAVNVDDPEAPVEFALSQNYPNPFNPTTTIRYSVKETSHVTINVYNVTGQLVTTLVNESRSPGHYTATFDGTGLTSGVYIYRMQAGDFVKNRQLMLVK